MKIDWKVYNFRFRRYFSLVELLVVVTIFFILISLLSPSFSKMIAQSNVTSCQNNEKAIDIAFQLYVNDYTVFPLSKPAQWGAYHPYYLECLVVENDYIDFTNNNAHYQKTSSVLLCPVYQKTYVGHNKNVYNWVISPRASYQPTAYTFTGYFGFFNSDGTVQEPIVKPHEVLQPSKRAYLLDGLYDGIVNSGVQELFRAQNPATLGAFDSSKLLGHHSGGEIVQFIDGHNKWIATEVLDRLVNPSGPESAAELFRWLTQ